jgi:hypothetical protein
VREQIKRGDITVIPRRGFFGKLAALVGLSAPPVQASEESAERKLRREKMAEKGLGPDDVRTSFMWERDPENPDNLVLRCYIDCHGETWGRSLTLCPGDTPMDSHDLITPLGTVEIPAVDRSR